MIQLRAQQREILEYQGGKMAIAAAPGAGKTWTLARLASEILARGELQPGQEVLVVTLVNSAVVNFTRRIGDFLGSETKAHRQRADEPAGAGEGTFRVRTLHGLAHDIVRERPGLVGLEPGFDILDDHQADLLRSQAVRAWLNAHPYDLDDFYHPELDGDRREWVRRERLPRLVEDLAANLIATAKDLGFSPLDLIGKLSQAARPGRALPLLEMVAEIYANYQRLVEGRGAVDFADLIRLAALALERDADFLARLRRRWPFILEDEAQDSSRLQEAILRTLCGPGGNWVRAGDANQAIYATFTTAHPHFFRDFMVEEGVALRELSQAGRSTPAVIKLANVLVDWTRTQHPVEAARSALLAPPYLQATQPGDPQPNPPDASGQVRILPGAFNPPGEIAAVADSLARWLPQHPQATVAVLAPRNREGFALVNELRRLQIPYEDSLLRSSSSTRFSAGALGNLLRFLAEPLSAERLATAYQVWRREERQDEDAQPRLARAAALVESLERGEDFIWPGAERDWLLDLRAAGEDPELIEHLVEFRSLVQRWLRAAALPVDQLIISLAQDLLSDPAELAVAYKLGILLRRAAAQNPAWRLAELAGELAIIARNERRFLGFSGEESGFEPDRYPGRVVVTTVHKAKGLEWDRVYLLAANNANFPSGQPDDRFVSESWFLRDRLNLQAEALAQLEALAAGESPGEVSGAATLAARQELIRERLRLLYVAVTRARRDLFITWNTGRRGKLKPALAVAALHRSLMDGQF